VPPRDRSSTAHLQSFEPFSSADPRWRLGVRGAKRRRQHLQRRAKLCDLVRRLAALGALLGRAPTTREVADHFGVAAYHTLAQRFVGRPSRGRGRARNGWRRWLRLAGLEHRPRGQHGKVPQAVAQGLAVRPGDDYPGGTNDEN